MFVAKTVLVRFRSQTVLVRFRSPGTEANKNCLCRKHFLKFVYMYVTTYSHNIQSTPDKMKVPGDSERLALIRRCSSSNDAPDMGEIADL